MTEKEQTIPKPATSGLALSIVIPVYNGAASIAELVRRAGGAADRGRTRDHARQ